MLRRVISINIGPSRDIDEIQAEEFGDAEVNNAVVIRSWGYTMVNLRVVKGSLQKSGLWIGVDESANGNRCVGANRMG